MKNDKKLTAKLKQNTFNIKQSQLKASKTAQLLQPNSQVAVEIDDDRPLLKYSQDQLINELPQENVQNIFNLALPGGPYRMMATSQTVYLAGNSGHISAFNWRHKQLECEFDVKEKCRDIVAIAQRNFAVAQQNAVYIYDPKGTELHKIRESKKPKYLAYLPYHFLLASLSEHGQLVYQDITQGKIVSTYHVNQSSSCMSLNPYNGVIGIGDALGVVKMYSPSTGTPMMSVLCHRGAVSSMAYSSDGNYLVTGGSEGIVKIWDIRTSKLMDPSLNIGGLIGSVAVSDKGVIAVGSRNQVVLWKDAIQKQSFKPYMKHRCHSMVNQLEFVKHEDYLAIAKKDGYEQIIVPESGEPFYDTYERQDYQNKKQRREYNVRSLMEKLPYETITLNPAKIGTVDRTSKEVLEKEAKQLEELKASKRIKKMKHKTRGKSSSKQVELRKNILKDSNDAVKWQQMLSSSLRVKRAEKEKRKEEYGLLQQMEKLSAGEFFKNVK